MPLQLLRQNSELRDDRVWNWTLPAWVVKAADGTVVNVCPSAGACKDVCYALNGTYLFPAVRAAHLRNLQLVLDSPRAWAAAIRLELSKPAFRPTGIPRLPDLAPTLELDEWAEAWRSSGGAAVRIHDAGDFFSDDYLELWLQIARETPDVLFYAYTKEVPRFRRLVEGRAPINFRWLYSMGGKHDAKLDPDRDRHAEVFPDLETLASAGYIDQTSSDLLAVLLPTTRVGIPANNIPHYRKRLAGRTFGQLQLERPSRRREPGPSQVLDRGRQLEG